MDCSPPGSCVHGISQARILYWVAISFSRGSSWPRDWTHLSCIDRHILYHWVTGEARVAFIFLNFNWRLITLQYCSCFDIHWHESAMGVHVFPILNPPPISHHPIPLGHPSAPALSTLYHALNLDWQFISHMIIYIFQCHSPISSCPRPLPQSPKDCSIHLCLLLSHIQGYCYHLSKFHIYALVYCIGVFLSGLLHSV